jgi:hypothetical protein
MTRDIDLLLPVDAKDNARLLRAVKDIAATLLLEHLPKKAWLDKGFSTAAEGEIGTDFMFVAADRKFEEYKPFIDERMLGDTKLRILNIDGMLLSKETGREEDLPDRQRLRRLKE